MKRRAAIFAALVFSIGLHVVLITAGREHKPPSKVPDRLYSATIDFAGQTADGSKTDAPK